MLRVVVDLNRFGQGLWVTAITLPGHVAPLRTVVVLVDEVVSRSEGHKPSVVGGRRDGHGASAADVRVAQLVRQQLQLVRCEAVIVPEHMVMRGTTRALDACVAAQVKVELRWVCDGAVHCGACRDVPTLPNPLSLVGAEQSGVVPLLDHDVCDAWSIILL